MVRGGVCVKHGAKRTCSVDGCTNHACGRRGVCYSHGFRDHLPKCRIEGCNTIARRNGLCQKHLPRIECGFVGCKNKRIVRGRCHTCDRMIQLHGEDKAGKLKIESDAKDKGPRCNHIGGCHRKVHRRGKCQVHLGYYSKKPKQTSRSNKKCTEYGCYDKESDDDSQIDSVDENEEDDDSHSNSDDDYKADDRSSNRNSVATVRPCREILSWVRSMSDQEQRNCVKVGMRVKVRFKGSVWYGGVVTDVMDEGHKVKIDFDDGTTETSHFPDIDIVIDAEHNGMHQVDGHAFVPPCFGSKQQENGSEVKKSQCLDNEVSIKPSDPSKDESKKKQVANTGSLREENENDSQSDSDEEAEMGAIIYKSSLTAKSFQKANLTHLCSSKVAPSIPTVEEFSSMSDAEKLAAYKTLYTKYAGEKNIEMSSS